MYSTSTACEWPCALYLGHVAWVETQPCQHVFSQQVDPYGFISVQVLVLTYPVLQYCPVVCCGVSHKILQHNLTGPFQAFFAVLTQYWQNEIIYCIVFTMIFLVEYCACTAFKRHSATIITCGLYLDVQLAWHILSVLFLCQKMSWQPMKCIGFNKKKLAGPAIC